MPTTHKQTTHTPGPWYTMPTGRNEYQTSICQDPTGNTVALTYTSNDRDAYLIAAAPELLEALKHLLTVTELNMDDMERDTRQHIQTALQAIAHAEGRD